MQRIVTDFSSDHAFGRVNKKLKEHYGIELPIQAPRRITLQHAQAMAKGQRETLGKMDNTPKACIISETDGSMVPIVKAADRGEDRRKHKSVVYREARLTLAHEQGMLRPVFSATLGDVQTAGAHIAHCIRKVGLGKTTSIHAVGDGAPWIAAQLEEQFGAQATYLVDFYHVCEYLANAAERCAKDNKQDWLEQQKNLLKMSRTEEVLINLLPFIEQEAGKDTPVRDCYRYIENRLHQMDYKTALEKGLPIGSGEVESAHRYVVQERLKIQGAWWLEQHAEQMLALRTLRANNDWNDYWETLAA